MDLNVVVLALIVLGMVSAFIRRLLSGVPLRYQWGWLVSIFLVLGLAGFTFRYIPDRAGYITGVVWYILFLVPTLSITVINQNLSRQRYRQAYNLAKMVAFLHPADGFRE